MSTPFEIVNNSHVGPFIIGLHFHKIRQEFPDLTQEPSSTNYLRFDYQGAISLYIDKQTSNLVGVKVLQADIAQYLGVMVGTTRSQVKKLQSPPKAPGITLEYVDGRVQSMIVFSEQEDLPIPNFDEIQDELAPQTLDFQQIKQSTIKIVPIIAGILIVIALLFGSFQYSKHKLKAKPSFTFKAVVGQTKDKKLLSFTINIHPKVSTRDAKIFHRRIRDELQNHLISYINDHSKKELILFNKGPSLAVNISKYLNIKTKLLQTDHELVVKNIRIRG
ncbi:MAG: hypothetical protein KC646_00070 [Candidatus Cloacimonetes bacterium]|nr:hypothetical protein [Candidatus Cloacimonadota bacterium]